MGALQVLLVQEPHILSMEYLRPREISDPVIRRIPRHGGGNEKAEEQRDVQGAERGERACGKEQGIPGKERGHDKAGLALDDEKKNQVRQCAVVLDHHAQMLVQVHEDIDYVRQQFHTCVFYYSTLQVLLIVGTQDIPTNILFIPA